MALPPGFTSEELETEVLEAAWRVPPPLPDTVVTLRDGWRQIRTPSLTQGGLNEITGVRREESEIEEAIDRAIVEFSGSRFRVDVTARTRPADLAERLGRRGFIRAEVSGVARDLSPMTRVIGVEVDAVSGDEDADEFTRVMAQGWERDASAFTTLHRAMAASPHYRMFIARVEGTAVGTAAYALGGKTAHLIGGVVLPPFRRRGVYQALVAARIEDARERGATLATSHANATTSAPILKKLGFEVICEFAKMMSPE